MVVIPHHCRWICSAQAKSTTERRSATGTAPVTSSAAPAPPRKRTELIATSRPAGALMSAVARHGAKDLELVGEAKVLAVSMLPAGQTRDALRSSRRHRGGHLDSTAGGDNARRVARAAQHRHKEVAECGTGLWMGAPTHGYAAERLSTVVRLRPRSGPAGPSGARVGSDHQPDRSHRLRGDCRRDGTRPGAPATGRRSPRPGRTLVPTLR